MLTDEVKVQDGYYIVGAAAEWPESRAALVGWIKEHFPDLKKRTPSALVPRLASPIASMCHKAARDDAATFFGPSFHDVDGGDRALQQTLETADLCIELRAREGARAKKRLSAKRR